MIDLCYSQKVCGGGSPNTNDSIPEVGNNGGLGEAVLLHVWF